MVGPQNAVPWGITNALCEWAAKNRGHASCTYLLYSPTCSVGPHKLKVKLLRISGRQQLRVNQTWGSSEHAALFDCACHTLMTLTDSGDATVLRMAAYSGQWTRSWVWLCATLSQMWDVQEFTGEYSSHSNNLLLNLILWKSLCSVHVFLERTEHLTRVLYARNLYICKHTWVSVLESVLLKGAPDKSTWGHQPGRQCEEWVKEKHLRTEEKLVFVQLAMASSEKGQSGKWRQKTAPDWGQSSPPPAFLWRQMVRSMWASIRQVGLELVRALDLQAVSMEERQR